MTDNGGIKTPPRNNYCNSHTPIASIKRPRSSLTNGRTSSDTPKGSLSPMHPVRPVHRDKSDGVVAVEEDSTASWVGRKVDALFSPVLRFLDQQEKQDEVAKDTDTHPSTSSSSSGDSPCESAAKEEEELIDHADDGSISIQGQEMPDMDEFNPWQFIQSLPPYDHVRHLAPPVTLPPKDRNAPDVSLVLDLDETLVHCSVEPVSGADLTFPVDFHGATYQVHVKLRPHLFTFLEACRGKFEVILFTASQKIYANELLNRIDPEGKYIQHRLYRESCLAVEGNFLKDLNVLGRDLSKTILVDNSPHAFGYQVDNGIPIESWFDDPEDRELLKLERFLRQNCLSVKDVRPVLRQKFQCQRLVDEAPPLYTMEYVQS